MASLAKLATEKAQLQARSLAITPTLATMSRRSCRRSITRSLLHTVAASITYGCSLDYLRLQAEQDVLAVQRMAAAAAEQAVEQPCP